MKLFENVAVVNNGASGVGLTLATSLVREGASVFITDADARLGRESAEVLEGSGGAMQHTGFVAMNSADPQSVDGAVRTILADCPTVDILVNVIRDDLYDALFAIRAFLPAMVAAGHGKIINVLCQQRAPDARPNKQDVIAMTQRLAGELGGNGIGVNCLCLGPTLSRHVEAPGGLATGGWPGNVLSLPGATQRLADIIAFFAGSASDYMNGEVLHLHEGACKTKAA